MHYYKLDKPQLATAGVLAIQSAASGHGGRILETLKSPMVKLLDYLRRIIRVPIIGSIFLPQYNRKAIVCTIFASANYRESVVRAIVSATNVRLSIVPTIKF